MSKIKFLPMAFFLGAVITIVIGLTGCKAEPEDSNPQYFEELGIGYVSEKVTEEACSNELEIVNWENNLSISASRFATVKAGDEITIKTSVLDTSTGDGKARIYVYNTDWKEIHLENVTSSPEADYVTQNNVSKLKFGSNKNIYTITIKITKNDAEKLQDKGILFSGSNFILKSVTLTYTKQTVKSDKTLEEQYELLEAKRQESIDKYSKKYKLPIIYITTNNLEDVVLKEYYDSIVDVVNCDEKYRLPDDVANRKAGVKVRGNSTAWGDDKPYRIKFEKKNSMLGLHDGEKYKSWVLLKTGWSIACDYLGFNLAHEIYKTSEYKYYASDATYAHVIINGLYKGLYLLCEQNQTGKKRVDIYEPEKKETQTKIGYMIELDNYAWEDLKDGNGRWFGENGETNCSQGIEEYHFNLSYISDDDADNEEYEEWGTVKKAIKLKDVNNEARICPQDDFTLKNDVYSDEQVKFIYNYVKGVWKICYNAIEKGRFLKFNENYEVVAASEFTNAKQTCDAIVDLESLCNEIILEELVRDNDVGAGSLYMAVDFTKEEGEKYHKFTFECPWDFNWAYQDIKNDSDGGTYWNGKTQYFAGAWQSKAVHEDGYERSHPWFILFNNAPWFRKMLRDKWEQIGTENLLNTITTVENNLAVPLKECNVSQSTTDFVKRRIDYMDKNLWKE